MKIVFLKHIPDCLGVDRVGDDIVDKFGGLNSIGTPSSGNLTDNGLFVTRRKLGKTATSAIFFIPIYFLLDPSNGEVP